MPAKLEGLQSVLANIRAIIPVETGKMNARLAISGTIVEDSVKNHAAMTDHTLKQLADMGHPYSKRYSVDSGPHPDNAVHSQSGTLLANIEKSENLNMVQSTVEVGVQEDKVPYIGDLITGTSKQRPRNFIGEGFNQSLDGIIATTQGR
ncbi:hypothetical protein Ga0466249_002292 [Sporomusaceae bacterium BoRhaA]|uniref:hypothetical protein n=1 Tax=Pelorhabdus rhamnosifermentans TaxID=2772457 RepID=UPI001C060B5A|nr:hypothetical protein [Pelorhabdus rhamnosifermentans]MBU2701178.1 hypothetical protein [Pelorhabdus rhamnosifermentans]